MSAFKVYGVSYKKCLERARKKTSSEGLTPGEWEEECKKNADSLFASSKPVAISTAMDAPKFCREFIALCDPDHHRCLSVYAYQKTKGTVQSGKRKGMPRYAWLPYKGIWQ